MKNVKTGIAAHSLSGRLIAFILAFAMIIGVCPAAFATSQGSVDGITTHVIKVFDAASQIASSANDKGLTDTATVKTGEGFIVQASAGFKWTTDTVNSHTVRLYVGDLSSAVLTYFPQGGKAVGESRTVDGITYTIGYEAGEYYLGISEAESGTKFVSGSTIGFPINVYFDKTAAQTANANMVARLVVDGTELDKVTISPRYDVEMHTTKTADTSDIILTTLDGEETIQTALVYRIQSYPGDSMNSTATQLNSGEAAVASYTITDTFKLPEGLYFESEDAAVKAVSSTFSGFVVKNFIKDGDHVTGFDITYTVINGDTTKQVKGSAGTITIAAGSIHVPAGQTTFNDITNDASTSYTLKDGTNKTAQAPQVKTTVIRPSDASYTSVDKSVIDAIDRYNTWNPWGGYVLNGDYVLYKVSFTNGGGVTLTDGTFTDTLGEGLIPASPEEIDALKGYFNDNTYKSMDWSSMSVAAWGDSGSVSVSGNTYTFSGITLEAGAAYNGYILAKIDSSVTTDKTLYNTAKVGGVDVSATVTEKPNAPSLSIWKNAIATENGNDTGNIGTYVVGNNQNLRYEIVVKNNGTAYATNVTIADLFPQEQYNTIALSNITVTTAGGADLNGNEVTSNNYNEESQENIQSGVATVADDSTLNLKLSNVTIPVGGSVTISIPATILETTSNNIINTASATCEGKTVTATNTLKPYVEGAADADPIELVALTKNKVSSAEYVQEGDEVTYSINFKSGHLTNRVLVIFDALPEWLTYNEGSASAPDAAGAQSNMSVETVDGGLKFKFTQSGQDEHNSWGNYFGNYPNGITITYTCTVNSNIKNVPDGTTFANTAEIEGGTSATSGEIIVGTTPENMSTTSSTGLSVLKEGWITKNGSSTELTDANKVTETNKFVEDDDIVIYRIKISNVSNSPITEFTLTDHLQGKYNARGNNVNDYGNWLSLGLEIVEYNDAKGIGQNVGGWGSTFICNQNDESYTPQYTGSGNYMIAHSPSIIKFTNKPGIVSPPNGGYYNPDFKINAGGYIVLEGALKIVSAFDIGSNVAKVDDSGYSGFYIEKPSKLSISKTAIKDDKQLTEIVCENEDELRAAEIPYEVTITNNSNVSYTTQNAYFADELPQGVSLKAPISIKVDGETVSNAVFQIGKYKEGAVHGDWSDSNITWTDIDNSGTNVIVGDVLRVQFNGTVSIPAGKVMVLNYTVVPSEDNITNTILPQVRQNSSYGGFDFDPQDLRNYVYFYGEDSFFNDNNKPVNTLVTTYDVKLRAESVHPGLKKTAYAHMGVASDKITIGNQGAAPGAYLIWRFDIYNGANADGTGKTLSGYQLKDILPAGYSYVGNNTYMNNRDITYPTALTGDDGIFSSGKLVKYDAGGNKTEIDYTWPSSDTKDSITFDFSGEQYNLEPGEHLAFTIITKPDNLENTKSSIYYNKGKLIVEGKVYEDTVNIGTIEGNDVTSEDKFALNAVATSSKKSVALASGDSEYADGILKAKAGDTVRYTLDVKNETSTSSLENFEVIDRLPFVGDTAVLSDTARGSQFDVELPSNMDTPTDMSGMEMTVTLNGASLTQGTDYEVTFSSVINTVLGTSQSDWDSADKYDWGPNIYASSKLMRIKFLRVIPENGQVSISFNAKLPKALEDTTIDQTAWNTFAYRYDSETNTDMAAEPEPVGVKIDATMNDNATIRVRKVYTDNKVIPEGQAFYFTIYAKEYEEGLQPVVPTQGIRLRSNGDGTTAVQGDVVFEDLPYTMEAGKETRYYIYETDVNGHPLKQGVDSNYVMYTGYYKKDGSGNEQAAADGNYCYLSKGLSMSKTSNSAVFSNRAPVMPTEPTVTILGTYYSDIVTNNAYATANNDRLYTGRTTFAADAKDPLTARVSDYGKKYNAFEGTRYTTTYDGSLEVNQRTDGSGKNWIFGDGFGNNQGHTVSTGFLAKIVGGDTAVKSATWTIKSQPQLRFGDEEHSVYVRLSSAEYTAFASKLQAKGYKLADGVTYDDDMGGHDSKIYEIVYDDTFNQADLTSAENAVSMGTDEASSEIKGDLIGDIADEGNAGVNEIDDGISFGEDANDSLLLSDDDAALLAELSEKNVEENASRALKWTVKVDNMPTISGGTSTVYLGIILDQIYDREAHAVLTLNDTSGTNSLSDKATAAVGNADQVNVMNPNDSSVIGLPLISSEVTWNLVDGADFNELVDGNALSKDGKAYVNGGQTFSSDGLRIGPNQYVTLNVPANAQITVTAKGGSADATNEGRALTVKDEDGNVIITGNNVKTSDAAGAVEGISYTCISNQTGVFYGSTPEPKSFTLTKGGIINITSTNSNLNIREITVTIPTTSGGTDSGETTTPSEQTITWDFSEFPESKKITDCSYNGLELVLNGGTAGDEVSSAGFRMNGPSSTTIRHIKYTPTFNGTMTVTYKSNNKDAIDRITAIGTAVTTFTDINLAPATVLASGYTEGSTPKTINAALKAGTTYYIYSANGGQTITKLEYVPESN